MTAPHEEELVAGALVACGATRLVPVLRVTARAGAWTSATAELVGVVAVASRGEACFLASAAPPAGAPSWSDWLAARPALLAAIRERLAASTDEQRRAAPGAAQPAAPGTTTGRERT